MANEIIAAQGLSEEDYEKIYRAGYDDGFERGYDKGYMQGQIDAHAREEYYRRSK